MWSVFVERVRCVTRRDAFVSSALITIVDKWAARADKCAIKRAAIVRFVEGKVVSITGIAFKGFVWTVFVTRWNAPSIHTVLIRTIVKTVAASPALLIA